MHGRCLTSPAITEELRKKKAADEEKTAKKERNAVLREEKRKAKLSQEKGRYIKMSRNNYCYLHCMTYMATVVSCHNSFSRTFLTDIAYWTMVNCKVPECALSM